SAPSPGAPVSGGKSMTRKTLPPRAAGGMRMMTPSGTGSGLVFDAGAVSVIHSPARTGSRGPTSAAGIRVSETMHERPLSFTPVTIRRIFPGTAGSLRRTSVLARHGLEEGITERSVRFRGPIQITDAPAPRRLVDQPFRDGALPDAFHHRRERL